MIQKGDKKIIRGWVMYDWANSVYNLVISSSVFPIFYEANTRANYAKSLGLDDQKLVDPNDVTVDFFGLNVSPSVLYSMVLSFSFLMVSFFSPLLSGIADYTGSKKRFLQFFCYLGAFACTTLYFFDASRIELGMLSILFGSIGFWNSLVFYNSFLPEIAERDQHDRISARGFILGYIGSMICLVICLAMIMGIGPHMTKYSFLLVGVWWVGFAQITYAVLPNNIHRKKPEAGYIWKGFKELKKVFQEFQETNRLKKYLRAFFFFNTGVQTVMLMATIFASKAIKWPGDSGTSGLITAILLIQILGAIGARLMSELAIKVGNIRTLIGAVIIWIAICAFAFIVETPIQFYFLAAAVGLVMGGVQAIARSTYSKFLPDTTDTASYFSFYDATEKVGIVLGTAFFGGMEYFFDNIRYSVFSVAFFFVLGIIFLLLVPKNEIALNKKEI
jgi:MFS transporter, UMF1 family